METVRDFTFLGSKTTAYGDYSHEIKRHLLLERPAMTNLSFPGGSDGKASAWNVGDPGLIPGLGQSLGEGNGNPLQYSCLENPMDRVPSGLQSIGSQRVGHNKSCSMSGSNLDSILKSRDITLLTKVCLIRVMVFSSSHVWMWELDYKESCASKNWCFWTVVLEKTLESPLDCKAIKPVNPEGNQYWIFIGRTDAEAETPILWPSDEKNWLIRKDPDAGKDWRWEKGTIENEMIRWHHRHDGHESE